MRRKDTDAVVVVIAKIRIHGGSNDESSMH